ncbi:tyrosine--tRNA ligase [Candidatus Parcubacteria bacterium]|nr:tyrosine--tRNA ligase [Candidatus Parcubacteria bacterium]
MDREAKITELLIRGVEDIFIRESLEKRLRDGAPLRIKLGIDPTGPAIHLGRAIPLRKLRAFQDLGHTAVLVVGDFTARIGDPSDKIAKRPMLSATDVKAHMKTYKKQLAKIIDITKAEVVYNSKWLSKLKFEEIAELAETFSVQQMTARRNFKDRIDRGEEISVREFLYPLMQGYDSVAINADVEIGGFDQLFNLKAGRVVQRHYKKPEQDVLTTQMLEGTDGQKMSTSQGNVIAITDAPDDMYGKIMSIRDELITKYFLLCTDTPESEIEKIKNELSSGANPRDIKLRLAEEIVRIYHGDSKAKRAAKNFIKTFAKGGIPDDVTEVSVTNGTRLDDILLNNKLVESKSDFRRLLDGNAIEIMDTKTKISDPHFVVTESGTFKVGKRRFIKITAK